MHLGHFRQLQYYEFVFVNGGHMNNQKATREIIKNNYPEMTNEEYREELQKLFNNVENTQVLRYFYIFASEKLKRVT